MRVARDHTKPGTRPGKTKTRLDALLVARGLAETRTRAQAAILAGNVFSGERRLDKPGLTVAPDLPLTVRTPAHPWVSRGGVKLAHALAHFAIPVDGRTALDIGASTGGFTDVLLSQGAARVYAVDVGYGQLAHALRTDARVIVLERTNARHLTAAQVPEPIDLVVCDASFIGLRTILPAPLARTGPGAHLVALIKPQFEAGAAQVGKGGIVRDQTVHEAICATIRGWLSARAGWHVMGLCESPISGADGNKEFLIAALRAPSPDG